MMDMAKTKRGDLPNNLMEMLLRREAWKQPKMDFESNVDYSALVAAIREYQRVSTVISITPHPKQDCDLQP